MQRPPDSSATHTPPHLGLPGRREGSLDGGNGRRGQGTHYSQNKKERNKANFSLGRAPPAMGTEPGNSKKCWEGLRKASQPVSELLTRNIHTLSGRKRSTEAHTHIYANTLSAFCKF